MEEAAAKQKRALNNKKYKRSFGIDVFVCRGQTMPNYGLSLYFAKQQRNKNNYSNKASTKDDVKEQDRDSDRAEKVLMLPNYCRLPPNGCHIAHY